MIKKHYYILYEVEDRDLVQRLLICLELALNNHQVYLVSKYYFYKNINKFPKGLILEKGITTDQYSDYKKAFLLGFKLSVIDEEGVRYYDREKNFIDIRVNKNISKKIDNFFCWGKRQKQMLSFIDKKKLIVSGSPKFDLYKKKLNNIFFEQSQYTKKLKPFIFVPSNFTYATWPNIYFKKKISTLTDLHDKTNIKFWKSYKKKYEYKKKVLGKFIRELKYISKKFKNLTFVFRPHPNDYNKYWEKKFSQEKNIKVDNSFSVEPWIKNCEFTINNFCTTALEAYVAGKNSIIFDPFNNKTYNKHLYSLVSFKATNRKKLEKNFINLLKNKIHVNKSNFEKFNTYVLLKKDFSYRIIAKRLNDTKFDAMEINNLLNKNFLTKMINLKVGFQKVINNKISNRGFIYYKNIKNRIAKVITKYKKVQILYMDKQCYVFKK